LYSAGYTTPDQIRQKMVDGAKDLGASGWDSHYGYGMIQAYNSLARVPSVSTGKTTYAQLELLSFTGTGFTPGGSVLSCLSTDNDGSLLCSGGTYADGQGKVNAGTMQVGTNIPVGPQKFRARDDSTGQWSNAVQLTITSPVTVTITRTPTESSTSYITRYTTTTVTSYTSTSTSTSTIPTVITVVLVPLTITSTDQGTQFLTSVVTTTVTNYTSTTTSTSTSVVYTTVTASPGGAGPAGAGASSSMAYPALTTVLAIMIGHRVTAGRPKRVPKVRAVSSPVQSYSSSRGVPSLNGK